MRIFEAGFAHNIHHHDAIAFDRGVQLIRVRTGLVGVGAFVAHKAALGGKHQAIRPLGAEKLSYPRSDGLVVNSGFIPAFRVMTAL